MKKKVSFDYVFDRKGKITKKISNNGLIELRCYAEGKQRYYSTGIYILNTEWNDIKQRVVRHPHTETLNNELDILFEKVMKAQRMAYDNNKLFDLDNVSVLLKNSKTNTVSFSEFATNEIESNTKIREVTKRAQRNTLNKLKAYNGNKDVLFKDINFAFADGFVKYLVGRVTQNTIRKHHKNFKQFIKIAIKKGLYEKKNPCDDLKVKEQEVKIIALTWEQLQSIENLTFEPYDKQLSLFRDMFLFQSYTGLRVSDLMSLKPEHIKRNGNEIMIYKTTIKVNKHAKIPLHKLFPLPDEKTTRPIKVLEKYYDENKDFIFKPYEPQTYNKWLKEIAFRAKIHDIKLTSHIGRKTFTTLLANHVNISTFVVKNLLQHSNVKTTERYVFTDEKRVAENLEKGNWAK
ncbi:MAG: site-specific integrase [Bacteroidia bacterium]